MAKNEVRISIAEYTFSSGKKKNIRLNVDGKDVQILLKMMFTLIFNSNLFAKIRQHNKVKNLERL
jgi:hypothetical protein